jgi:hypothetical protein
MWSAPPTAGPVRQASADLDMRSGGPVTQAPNDPLEAYFDRLDAAFASTGSTSGTDPFAGIAPASNAAVGQRETIPLSRRPASGDSPASSSGDPFGDWDPDLRGDPARPAAAAPPPPAPPAPAAKRAAAPQAPPPAAPPRPVAPPEPVVQATPVQPPPPPAAVPPPPQASAPPAAPNPAPAPLPASLVDAFAALLAAEQKIGLIPSAATTATAPPPAPAAAPEPAPITDEMIEAISVRVLARLSEQSRPSILDVAERLVREEIERIKRIG